MTPIIPVDNPISVFDVANWRPIPEHEYAKRLGECFLTFDEPESVTTTAETLPDGRMRIVTTALLLVKDATNDAPPEAEPGPYLMVLYSDERGHAVSFVRTDVTLAVA